ncbi:hypothetical protein EJB05_33763, partial [Eragrostis curvula]
MATENHLPKRRLLLSAGSSASPVFQMKGSSRPAASSSSMVPVVGSIAAAAYVAEEDTDAMDCGVCFLPLKPPIFQCEVGHVVCAPCRDGLAAAGNGKCHVWGVATVYRQCHAMERLLESIHIACPNAPRGWRTTSSTPIARPARTGNADFLSLAGAPHTYPTAGVLHGRGCRIPIAASLKPWCAESDKVSTVKEARWRKIARKAMPFKLLTVSVDGL